MTTMRRIGLGLAATAALLWVFSVVLMLTFDSGGADIGAGLIGLAALSLSIVGLIVLLVSLRAGPGAEEMAARMDGRDTAVGRPLAITSLVLLAGSWVFGASADDVATGLASLAALVAGVITFLVSVAFFVPSRRPWS